MSDGLMDYPNRQALGLDPPWAGAEEAQPRAARRESVEQQTGDQEEDLDAWTKEELLDHAQSLGVSPANKNMTKQELLDGIKEHEEQQG